MSDSPSGSASGPHAAGRFLVDHPNATGINDDDSGTATDLEIALQMAKLKVKADEPRAVHLVLR